MADTTTIANDGAPKLLRRTVIKMTAAGAATAAVGGSFAGSATAQDSDAEIVFPAQQTDGFSIEIESATMPEGGFIALIDPVEPHEKIWPRVGETMPTEAEVIDAQTIGTTEYLEPGTHEDVVLQLDQPLDFDHNIESERAADQEKLYQVWMHKDTAGDQTFENVAPGEEDNRYKVDNPDKAPTEALDVVIADAHMQFVPFNPAELRNQLSQAEARIGEIEGRLAELDDHDTRLSELEQERETLRDEIDDLEARISELEDADTGTDDSDDTADDSDGFGSGFGIVTAIAGAAAGAVAAGRWLNRSEEEGEQ